MRQMVLLLAALALSGCLKKEVTHTLVITPGDGLSWTALETDVRSDEKDSVKRLEEERRYLTAAQANVHDVARGLALLGPLRIQTRVIRTDRPFTVVTDAEFQSFEFALRRFLTAGRLKGEVVLHRDGRATVLTIRVDVASASESDEKDDEVDGDALTALVEDFERYRIVINDGRFVAARGFEISEHGQRAVPMKQAWESIETNGGIFELSLTWTR